MTDEVSRAVREYIAELEPKWKPFLERLADDEHPPGSPREGWRAEDEAWYQMVRILDGVAAAYVAWQAKGEIINQWGEVDDVRVLELITPYVSREPDRRLFLSICQRLAREWKTLHKQ